uniref:Uncharacterized protein n=1 Tax=Nicotiana tabacum TaxID=4097 RepID=A0A1S3WZT6_TOBAC|nr:PREDICTED: uncharacterized protein LOC107759606 [Nicotiana tabacum]
MDSLSSVPPSIVLPPGKFSRHHHHRRRISALSSHAKSKSPFPQFQIPRSCNRMRSMAVCCKLSTGGDKEEEESSRRDEEVERALRMDGTIPGTPNEFVEQVSSRAYDMRRHLQQSFDSSSYDGKPHFSRLFQLLLLFTFRLTYFLPPSSLFGSMKFKKD